MSGQVGRKVQVGLTHDQVFTLLQLMNERVGDNFMQNQYNLDLVNVLFDAQARFHQPFINEAV